MGFVDKTPSGKFKAYWREPSGSQRSKTFGTEREAKTFLASVEVTRSNGTYVSPHAGRTRFGEHAKAWMDTWNNERTTSARDKSIMKTHVLPQWENWQLGKIDHLSVQKWITELSAKRSRATVVECKRLTSGVIRSAMKNRLIGTDPTAGIRIPKRRIRDTDEQVISRDQARELLLPAVRPDRYRTLVATAAFTGMRWGETIGLCRDAVNLDDGVVSVIRTVTEVAGHMEFKPFPKSAAGRRTIPVPNWLADDLEDYMSRHPAGRHDPIFTNDAGNPLSRTLFRSRVWRPALVRAGLLGEVAAVEDKFEAVWMDQDGDVFSEVFGKYEQAVQHVARSEHGGLRFHDLRHSYGTWLADDGIPPHRLAKIMGHENVTTTMQLYVRRTDDHATIRESLGDGLDD